MEGNGTPQDTLLNTSAISVEQDVLRPDPDRGRRSPHTNSYGSENAFHGNAGRRDEDTSGTRERQQSNRSLLVDELENVYGDLNF